MSLTDTPIMEEMQKNLSSYGQILLLHVMSRNIIRDGSDFRVE